jgi:hypothetical protein
VELAQEGADVVGVRSGPEALVQAPHDVAGDGVGLGAVARRVDDRQQRVVAAIDDRGAVAAAALAGPGADGGRRAPAAPARGEAHRPVGRGAPRGRPRAPEPLPHADGGAAARGGGDLDRVGHAADAGEPQAERSAAAVVVLEGQFDVGDAGPLVAHGDLDVGAALAPHAAQLERPLHRVLEDVGAELADDRRDDGALEVRGALQQRGALAAEHRELEVERSADLEALRLHGVHPTPAPPSSRGVGAAVRGAAAATETSASSSVPNGSKAEVSAATSTR